MAKLRMGEIFRYARPYSPAPATISGYTNHFYATYTPGQTLAQLDSGINPIAAVTGPDGPRRPAILIRSSPHKIGSPETPWQDTFDPDNGHIRYYGDNKTPGKDAATAPGNKALLEAFQFHSSYDPAIRGKAVPVIFYHSVTQEGKHKGFVRFSGFGIIRGVELVTQFDSARDRTFSNFAYDFHIFSLANENDEFDWDWISDRRNQSLALGNTLNHAPNSWKLWLREGTKVLEKCRRRVSKKFVVDKNTQMPEEGTREYGALVEINKYYSKKKAKFEGLAFEVLAYYLRSGGMKFRKGWITPPSWDGGADFYGRLDIGFGFGMAKVIVIGQAKCESLNKPTSGNHIARTVARLKRGWLGAYVTTSYFSKAVQQEIIEDAYPILLINGKLLAETALSIVYEKGCGSLHDLLEAIENQYEIKVQNRRPEELLLD